MVQVLGITQQQQRASQPPWRTPVPFAFSLRSSWRLTPQHHGLVILFGERCACCTLTADVLAPATSPARHSMCALLCGDVSQHRCRQLLGFRRPHHRTFSHTHQHRVHIGWGRQRFPWDVGRLTGTSRPSASAARIILGAFVCGKAARPCSRPTPTPTG